MQFGWACGDSDRRGAVSVAPHLLPIKAALSNYERKKYAINLFSLVDAVTVSAM